MRKLILISTLLVLSLTLSACAKKAPPPPPPSYHTHTISAPGETLAIIASWYTGESQNWKAIAAANPNLKPNKLRIGDVVQIPSELVIKQDPLTKKTVQNILKKSPKSDQKVETPPAPTPSQPESNPAPAQTQAEQVATPAPVAPSETAADAKVPAVEAPPVTQVPAVDQSAPSQDGPIEPAQVPSTPESAVVVSTPSASDQTRDDLIDEILSK